MERGEKTGRISLGLDLLLLDSLYFSNYVEYDNYKKTRVYWGLYDETIFNKAKLKASIFPLSLDINREKFMPGSYINLGGSIKYNNWNVNCSGKFNDNNNTFVLGLEYTIFPEFRAGIRWKMTEEEGENIQDIMMGFRFRAQ